MSEHISKSEDFVKKSTVKSSTLDQNISILGMSCDYIYKKICGYEADRCHAKKIIYIYVLVQIISLLL